MSLDQMTVGAEQLDVIAQTESDFSVEGDAVFDHALVVTTAVDMVDLKHARISDVTAQAGATQLVDGFGSPLSVAPLAGLAGQFISTSRVGSAPGIDSRLLAPVDAGSADVTSTSSVEREALYRDGVFTDPALTGFHGTHSVNPTGIRKSVDYDALMGVT